MKTSPFLQLIGVLALLGTTTHAAVRTSGSYSVPAEALDSGGRGSTSASYIGAGSIGLIIGTQTSAAYGVDAGYLPQTVVAPTLQETWRQTYFGTTANSGNAADTANPDGDMLNNLGEWAFGLNPTVSDTSAIVVNGAALDQRGTPTVSVNNIPGGVDFRALFGRRKDYIAAGLAYAVQFSPDLTLWQNSTATPTVIADDAEIEACTVPYPFFINGKKARFFRVSVSVTP